MRLAFSKLILIRHSFGISNSTETRGEAGGDKRKLMNLSPAVTLLTSSPSTGEDRGEGALNFYPLTLTLSRQGRENPSPCIVQQAKYFVGLRLIPSPSKDSVAVSKSSVVIPNDCEGS